MTLPLEPRGTLDVNGDIVLGKNEEGTTIPVSEKSQVDICINLSPLENLKKDPVFSNMTLIYATIGLIVHKQFSISSNEK